MKRRREDRLACKLGHTHDNSKIKLQAMAIESLLYKQSTMPASTSDQDDASEKSIDDQLRFLLTRILQCRRSRSTKQGAEQAVSPADHRAIVLRELLGDEQFAHAQSLIHNIRMRGGSLIKESSYLLSSSSTGLEKGSMPGPVRRLFFGTALVTAWHHTALTLLATVPWSEVIQQAELHLHEYAVWLNGVGG
jgi:hypothetical protein